MRCPFFKQRDAIGIGHPNVQQNQIGARELPGLPRLSRILRQLNRVPLIVQDLKEQVSDSQLIINNQYICHT